MPAPKEIYDLVARFREQLEDYKLGKYKETQVRKDFIDPFFEALGWDMGNKGGYASNYRDVIYEDNVNVEGRAKNPDYAFCIGGQRKFFVEAKKPSINIKTDKEPALQVRRYGWNAKLPLSIVTDFEEFSVYDTRIKPLINDKVVTARMRYYTFEEYIEKWDEIADIFSKEAVLKGKFDSFFTKKKGKGTAEVDEVFLKDIEKWREILAKNIVLRNDNITSRNLNYVVQITIDRILFLRICEDRSIEPYGRLENITTLKNIYKSLLEYFYQADDKYNSGLFHFKNEKNRTDAADTLTPEIAIDDKILKEIIKGLYYPQSPYEFSIMSADILGNVYEKFLGKNITLTESGKSVRIEEKPEVRKAGGVYYTPKYIVDYIVENTVGALLKDKTPNNIKNLTVLDPACGSGSFLIVAYQHLLDYYLDCYTKKPNKYKKQLIKTHHNSYRLTISERKRILLAHIYGVDIDAQAVEVTKLSLLLKVLEGENEASINQTFTLLHERALPSLADNIKCGNSLIAPDFYGQGNLLIDDEERYRLNVFDWEDEQQGFGKIMKQGGFDAVIGNPPYARIQTLRNNQTNTVDYYQRNYVSASGSFDIYILFIQKAYGLLNQNGIAGYIQPHKFLQSEFGEGIRNFLAKRRALQKFVHFGMLQIFAQATTYCGLMFLSKQENKKCAIIQIENEPEKTLANVLQDNESEHVTAFTITHPQHQQKWYLLPQTKQNLLNKLLQQKQTIADVTNKIFQGIPTGNDAIYILKIIAEQEHHFIAYSKALDKNIEIEKGLVKLFLMGKDIKRYTPPEADKIVIFPYDVISPNPRLLQENELKNQYPLGWQYLLENKKFLAGREQDRFKNTWWQFSRPQNLKEFATQKIMSPEIANKSNMVFDATGNLYHTTQIYGFRFKDNKSEKYYLGVMNSSIMWFFLSITSSILRGGFRRFKTEYLKPFPIPNLDISKKADKVEHDKMVALVEKMLNLQKQKQSMVNASPHEKNMLEREINTTDKAINNLTYKLYGLTAEEIAIIEAE